MSYVQGNYALENLRSIRYIRVMTKAKIAKSQTGKWVVRDSLSGQLMEVRGANSMPSSTLPLKKGVDLTKPIAKQALSGRYKATVNEGKRSERTNRARG
ncbi:MAG: hypothetical protein AB7P20_24640 [Rhizobiaceae bacterium]